MKLSHFFSLLSAILCFHQLSAQTLPPTVTSPVNYCLGSPSLPLTATGTNLKWISTVNSSVGGTSKITSSTTYIDNSYNNKRTLFTTAVANVVITSVDFTIPAWQAVTGVKIGIFNSDGTVLLSSSSTTTSQNAGSDAVSVSNVFNYTIANAGTYSIGLVSGSGNFGTETFSNTIGASPVTIGGTSSGQRAFSNIKYTATVSSSTAPTPSTTLAGSTNYYVTQTVNNITSQPATITVKVNTTAAPTVVSPINLCQGSTPAALSANGTNLVWTSSISGSIGGSSIINSGGYVASSSNNRTTFTTAVSNVTLTSLDYYLFPYNGVSNVVLGIYDSEGVLLFTSPTSTTETAGATAVKITNLFNYTFEKAGTYSIGLVSGTGNIGIDYSSTTYPLTEPTATLSITGNTFSGKVFNNIQFSVTTVSSSTAPTPSTTYVGSSTYYVTETVNGCKSAPATIIVNVNGITSTTSGTGCSGGTVALSATASTGYTISWFDVASGGTAKATGASYTTPTLTASKTYYVSASNGSCTTTRVPVQAIIGGFRWVGNNSSAFNNAANWSSCTNTAPATQGTADLVIPQSTTNILSLDSDITINSLSLQGNAKLNLNGYTLTVSSISGTGSIIGNRNSRLILNGTGNVSLRFDQTTAGQTNALKVLTINGNSRKVVLENSLTISDAVNISGSSILNSNGYLTLESSKSSIASIGPLLNGAAVVGNVRVQAFLSGSSQYYRNFRTIASPVNDISSPSKAYRIAGYKSTMLVTGPGGIANGFDPSPNNGSTIKFYNELKKNAEVQYLYPANAITESIPQGKGIYFYYRGNKDNTNGGKFSKVNGSYLTPEDVVMEYYGEINSGNISPAITYTNHAGEGNSNGLNLIGNPYPCVIDWNSAGVLKNNLDNTIWVQKQNGTFAILKGDVSTNGGSRYILPGQGFFIKANSANPSVTFTESAKVSSTAPSERLLYKGQSEILSFSSAPGSVRNASIQSSPIQKLNVQLVKDEFASDETAIIFTESSSKSLDQDDILYQGEGAVTLTTITPDNKYLAINYTGEMSGDSEISLYATATESGTYTLKISDYLIDSGYGVFLKDLYLNSIIDLSSQPSYTFDIDKAIASSYGAARFKLQVLPVTTLPLNHVSFTGKSNNKGVELRWTSDQTARAVKFDVEHSFDGKEFYPIAQIGVASGQSTFSYLDAEAVRGDNYYRLKQQSDNGSFVYSKIISVNFAPISAKLQVYPNPATKQITAELAKQTTAEYIMNVFDLRGVKILSARGTTLEVSSLTKGTYIVEIADSIKGTSIGRTRFIKD